MKVKISLDDADTDRTEVHQIKSTSSTFDFRRVQKYPFRVSNGNRELGTFLFVIFTQLHFSRTARQLR